MYWYVTYALIQFDPFMNDYVMIMIINICMHQYLLGCVGVADAC